MGKVDIFLYLKTRHSCYMCYMCHVMIATCNESDWYNNTWRMGLLATVNKLTLSDSYIAPQSREEQNEIIKYHNYTLHGS